MQNLVPSAESASRRWRGVRWVGRCNVADEDPPATLTGKCLQAWPCRYSTNRAPKMLFVQMDGMKKIADPRRL
jgi:hypothetical protein